MDMVRDSRSRGFTTIENAVIDTADLNLFEKMIYIVLSRFVDGDSESSEPSMQNIAMRLGLTDFGLVQSALYALKEKKYIEIVSSKDDKENIFFVYYLLELPASVDMLFVDAEVGGN